jgi:AraC family transcriptional regulator
MHRQYGEALGILMAHDLVRVNGNADLVGAPADRGGLAGWQQRRLAEYIEEHVSDNIPLAALSQLVQLSPYHLCRSFKQSFGMPPRKYHSTRRIERAKQLLATRELSITTIARVVGFGETSTFTAAFHRLTGQAPSRYRRNLD